MGQNATDEPVGTLILEAAPSPRLRPADLADPEVATTTFVVSEVDDDVVVLTSARRGRHFAGSDEPAGSPDEPDADEPGPSPADDPTAEPAPEPETDRDPEPEEEWVDTLTGYFALPLDLVRKAAPVAQPWLDAAAAFVVPDLPPPAPAEPPPTTRVPVLDQVPAPARDRAPGHAPLRRVRMTRAALTAREAESACRYRVAVLFGTDGPSLQVRSVRTSAGRATVQLAEPDGSMAYQMTVEQVPGGVRVTRCRQVVL